MLGFGGLGFRVQDLLSFGGAVPSERSLGWQSVRTPSFASLYMYRYGKAHHVPPPCLGEAVLTGKHCHTMHAWTHTGFHTACRV